LEGDVADLAVFPDRAQIAVWAENQVAIAVNNGIMSGRAVTGGANIFAPLGNAMRAEVAAVYRNFIVDVLHEVVG